MVALRQANQVRSLRAKLKQDLREGNVRLEQILATGADYLASAEVFDLLVAVPQIGRLRGRLLRGHPGIVSRAHRDGEVGTQTHGRHKRKSPKALRGSFLNTGPRRVP